MKISVITVGSLKEKFWKESSLMYQKRISAYSKIEIIEIPDSNPQNYDNEELLLQDEANKINKALNKIATSGSYLFSLCIEGKELSSLELANKFDSLKTQGNNHFIFIVGASCGLHKIIKEKSNMCLSFGKITLPHNLARVVLLEQIYRCFKINSGEKYHK